MFIRFVISVASFTFSILEDNTSQVTSGTEVCISLIRNHYRWSQATGQYSKHNWRFWAALHSETRRCIFRFFTHHSLERHSINSFTTYMVLRRKPRASRRACFDRKAPGLCWHIWYMGALVRGCQPASSPSSRIWHRNSLRLTTHTLLATSLYQRLPSSLPCMSPSLGGMYSNRSRTRPMSSLSFRFFVQVSYFPFSDFNVCERSFQSESRRS